MSSLLRRIRKRAPVGQRRAAELCRARAAQARYLEAVQFDEQRRALFARLHEIATDFGEAADPVGFLAYARQQRRGYDPAHDGPSPLMRLLDDIDALDELEREWAENAKASPTAPAEQ